LKATEVIVPTPANVALSLATKVEGVASLAHGDDGAEDENGGDDDGDDGVHPHEISKRRSHNFHE
jgi:hypothetical protein